MLGELVPHLGVAIAALCAGGIWEVATLPDLSHLRSPDLAGNLGYALVNIGLVTPMAIGLLGTLEPYIRITSLDISPLAGLALGFFLFEGVTYGLHRLWHSSPRLMRFHRVHHAPSALHCLVAFRMHPVEAFLLTVLGNLPLVVIGMPSWGGIYVLLAERTYAVLLHARSPFRLGALGRIFASGEFHHAHHARGAHAYNFGGVVSLFDYVFGTAAPSRPPRSAAPRRNAAGIT